MNAPAPIAQYDELPLATMAPSSTHIQSLRRKHFHAKALDELAASFADAGILQPLVVRPHPSPSARVKYEIVAGERRYHAAGLAKLETVPVVVRALTDVQVLEIQLIENLQRAELTALEEAEGYRELMRAKGIKAEDLAPLVGKSRSWVYSRLNLLTLEGDARAALEDGRLDVSRALVVATVAQPNQRAAALALALETGYNDKPTYSVRELRHQIVAEKLSMPLVGAPFDPADATLFRDAGACGPCPRRTGNCDPEALDPDVCTNLACFHLKVKAAGERKRAAVVDAGGKVLKGEEARKLSPSVKTVYGHVDLDAICEADDFPEEEPKPPKGVDRWSDEWEKSPAMLAWSEREGLWQPRTYRALLAGKKFTPVLIEDPKTHALRELLPFAEAQKLLKKAGFNLPSHYNVKRPSGNRGGSNGAAPAKKAETPESKAKRELEERIAAEVEERYAERLFTAVRANYPKALGRAGLQRVAARLFQQAEWTELTLKAWKWSSARWMSYDDALKKAAPLTEPQLERLILDLMLEDALCAGDEAAEAKRYKVDAAKVRETIEREVRQKLDPKSAQPAPAKKAGKTAKKKSR
jgi:ParB/RepB/Spo0J family partition protein